nr:uncharacterized protein LOC117278936 [Nicotiana tomentosiformis]
MWMGRSNAPLEETDLECFYTFELEKARRWKGLEFFLVGGNDYGLGMIFYRPMMIDVANSELLMLMSNIVATFGKLEITAKTMHMTEATNKANYTNIVSIRSLGKSVVKKIFADNSDPHSPSDLDNISNDIFRTESSFGSYIPRAITGRVKMTLSSGKVSGNIFLKYYASGGLQEGNNIFLSCAISDMFSIRGAWLIFKKMLGKFPLRWIIIDAYTPYSSTEKVELLKISSMAAVIPQITGLSDFLQCLSFLVSSYMLGPRCRCSLHLWLAYYLWLGIMMS